MMPFNRLDCASYIINYFKFIQVADTTGFKQAMVLRALKYIAAVKAGLDNVS